jgi:hypothetical protein
MESPASAIDCMSGFMESNFLAEQFRRPLSVPLTEILSCRG